MFERLRGRVSGEAAAGIRRAAMALTGTGLVLMLSGCIFTEKTFLGIEIPERYRTAHGPLVTLPYSVELNDIPMMIVQHHESDYLLKRAKDQFDRLYAEGEHRAKIMALAIHPYISGQPHRIKYLEDIYSYVNGFDGVLHWNGVEILDWYRQAAK